MSFFHPVLREDLPGGCGVMGGFPRRKMHDVTSGYSSLIAVLRQFTGFLKTHISQMNTTPTFASEQLLSDMDLA